jgi:hypothetical protein
MASGAAVGSVLRSALEWEVAQDNVAKEQHQQQPLQMQ